MIDTMSDFRNYKTFFIVVKVVSGDTHDINVLVEGPNTHIIYLEQRKEYDSVEFNATVSKKINLKCVCTRAN